MTEDVYEPLARYRDEFRERFATLAREKFKELAKRSGVNVGANRALVAEIKKLEREADSTSSKKSCYGCLMAIGFVVAAAALIGAIAADGSDSETKGMCIVGIIAGLVFGVDGGCVGLDVFRDSVHVVDRAPLEVALLVVIEDRDVGVAAVGALPVLAGLGGLRLLEEQNVACVPGSAFGACGEGWFRFSCFSTPEVTAEAAQRLEALLSRP